MASLTGYEFRIASWGYLTRSERGRVYGLVMALTHDDLARLYAPSNSSPADSETAPRARRE